MHIVFAEFLRRVRPELAFARNPLRAWPLLLHRRLYYRLVVALEKRVFQRTETQLILTSRRSAEELARFYGRQERLPLIETGLDHKAFNPELRVASRAGARQTIGLRDETFTLLLIGNDWRKKGLGTLLEALMQLADLPVQLVVVSNEAAAVSQAVAQYPGLRESRAYPSAAQGCRVLLCRGGCVRGAVARGHFRIARSRSDGVRIAGDHLGAGGRG